MRETAKITNKLGTQQATKRETYHTRRCQSQTRQSHQDMNNNYRHIKHSVFLAILLIAAFIAGCSGGGATTPPGILTVSLTDAPACGYDKVYVTVNKVRIHQSASANQNDPGWSTISLNPARKINLLNLNNGVLDELGQTSLAAGHYTNITLILDTNKGTNIANSVVLSGSTVELALTTPSATQSGIKLNHEFEITSDTLTHLVLDFDACKSIVKADTKYLLKPVIHASPALSSGIEGYVDTALLAGNARVSAQQNGIEIRSTVPDATTGRFFLARLSPGNFDVVVTADAHATAVMTMVPVASTSSVVTISTSGTGNWITLPASATSHSISGTATLTALTPPNPDVSAYLFAQQNLGASAPVVTISMVSADATSGVYNITLPTASSVLSTYGTLPISPAGTGGLYTVKAAADGYTSQISADINIATADATQNFTLAP